jgi:FAD/FMN-containing dehydrogenase
MTWETAIKAGIWTAGLSPIWGAFVWVAWEGSIKPRFIPDAEIKALALAHIARYGERAVEMALIEEDRAWRYSDSFAQGEWKRVRQEIDRLSYEN